MSEQGKAVFVCPVCAVAGTGGIECPNPRCRRPRVRYLPASEVEGRIEEWLRLILKADSASDRERSLATLANMARRALHPKEGEPDA